jgi:hypothetical protein
METANPLLDALNDALDRLTAPHVPPPEEARELEQALAHLIAGGVSLSIFLICGA